jgi:hypothetical protein
MLKTESDGLPIIEVPENGEITVPLCLPLPLAATLCVPHEPGSISGLAAGSTRNFLMMST